MSKSKGKRYTEEQIIAILNEVESGKSVSQVCRDKGVSEQTVYRWKQRYGGMNIDELKKMKALEEENQRLKRIVASQALDIDILKEINAKKW